jgi:hypothetical protein
LGGLRKGARQVLQTREVFLTDETAGGVERRICAGQTQLPGDYGNRHHLEQFA